MTIQDNKMIALFMGGKTSKTSRVSMGHQNIWLPIHGVCRWDTVELGKGKILKYHKSWDWLIPVVEKIDCMDDYRFTVKMHWHFTEIIDNNDGCKTIIDLGASGERLNNTYQAVVKFIKWYENLDNIK